MKTCPECGSQISDFETYCPMCGFDPDFDFGEWEED